jgi:hypothetical protein
MAAFKTQGARAGVAAAAALWLSMAMIGAPTPARADASAPTAAVAPAASEGQALRLEIDGRPRIARIDLSRTFTVDIDLRPDNGRLTSRGEEEVKRLAKRLAAPGAPARRWLVVVSNDDYSASGRAGKAGFDRAKAIRDSLVDDKFPEELIVVAGWRSSADDPGLLSILSTAGRVVIAPVLFAAPEADVAAGTDRGRAVAFESANSRLTTAEAILPPPSPVAPATPPTVLLAPIPSDAGAAAPPPEKPVAAVEPTPAPDAPALAPKPAAPSPAEVAEDPKPTPRVSSSGKCPPPPAADDIDDYYPGGPLVPCDGTYPRHRK